MKLLTKQNRKILIPDVSPRRTARDEIDAKTVWLTVLALLIALLLAGWAEEPDPEPLIDSPRFEEFELQPQSESPVEKPRLTRV